ncbi:MAG: hypothetical protein P4L85_01360 [Paludisphaera borealis]|uniref:hypothetical protein n=1 Tax=Paludisphaera borealis TaxID=1387353 RepID=UPI002848E6A4|nr:hypothetical protein [Paludisphaera borealis]MDR3617968.1 hypothetical protein [Paludisphaera borealis]
MSDRFLGALASQALPLCGGLYFTLLGYRKIGKRLGEDPGLDARHARFGFLLRSLGPMIMIISGCIFVYDAFVRR